MIINPGIRLSRQCNIVVVEDDRILRQLMIDILTEMGATCLEFEAADDALIHLLNTPEIYNLLITDHSLPGQLSGADLVEMISRKWPKLPMILTTGVDNNFAWLPSNVIFLKKPWRLEQLVASVSTLVDPALMVPPES